MADRFFRLPGLRESDRHVQQDTGIGRVVTKRQTVGGQRALEVALALQRQPLVQVVEALGKQILFRLLTEQPSPEAHLIPEAPREVVCWLEITLLAQL